MEKIWIFVWEVASTFWKKQEAQYEVPSDRQIWQLQISNSMMCSMKMVLLFDFVDVEAELSEPVLT